MEEADAGDGGHQGQWELCLPGGNMKGCSWNQNQRY